MVNLQDQLRDTSYCIVDSKVPYHSHLVSLWKKKLLITSKETINWVCVFILCSRLILRVWLLNVFIYLLRTVIKTEGNNPHNSCSQFHGKSIICKDTIYSIPNVRQFTILTTLSRKVKHGSGWCISYNRLSLWWWFIWPSLF